MARVIITQVRTIVRIRSARLDAIEAQRTVAVSALDHTHDQTATAPDDADMLLGNRPGSPLTYLRWTLATVRATLRATFDTLYEAAGAVSAHNNKGTSAHGGIVGSTDSRLTDARTPTAHAATHATEGADALTPAAIGAVPVLTVAALPVSPVAGVVYLLTTADDTALAPPGEYRHNGTGWVCREYEARYALGNWGGATVYQLIPGVDYSATLGADLTAGWGVTMARPGTVRVRTTNGTGYTVALPAGTTKMRSTGALTALSAALSEWIVTSDGTTQDWSTVELVTSA